MKAPLHLSMVFLLLGGLTEAREPDAFFDDLDEALTWSTQNGNVRMRLSGLADLEYYHFQQPPPGLIESDDNSLVNPRLTLFLDGQFGSAVYVFVQTRVDRGFDPNYEGDVDARLDEYALRYTPDGSRGSFNFQLGKFATVVGNWVSRHQSWDNPFVTAPLPYENPTGIFDAAAATSPMQLFNWSHVRPAPNGGNAYFDQYRVPIVWGPSYASGAAIAGTLGKFDYAIEMKNTSLSSRPQSWDVAHTQWQNPTYSARFAYRPSTAWNIGISASTGTYLQPQARATLPPGYALDDYREMVVAQDLSYAWHHWQLWAECYEARFRIPLVGNADTLAYYVEAKYKFTPQFFGAVRWNQQIYGDIPDETKQQVPWGRDTRRFDVAAGYRFTAHIQMKLQMSFQSEEGDAGYPERSNEFAAQVTVRF
jgi:hypothetical protein